MPDTAEPLTSAHPSPACAVDWYDSHGLEVADGYERLDPDALYAWAADLMPPKGAAALDIGAGTGRDAAWLAGKGYRTTAVEPSATMRRIGRRRHPDSPVAWLDDRLPELARIRRLEPFDLVVLNAVWMHIEPGDRHAALNAVLDATAPGGLALMSLRHGPAPSERRMHPCRAAEISEIADTRNAATVRTIKTGDQRTRPNLRWTQIAIQRR